MTHYNNEIDIFHNPTDPQERRLAKEWAAMNEELADRGFEEVAAILTNGRERYLDAVSATDPDDGYAAVVDAAHAIKNGYIMLPEDAKEERRAVITLNTLLLREVEPIWRGAGVKRMFNWPSLLGGIAIGLAGAWGIRKLRE